MGVLGHRHSKKTRQLMSLKARGKNNPFYGKTHSKTVLEAARKRMTGKKNPFYGKKHSSKVIAHLRKLALARVKKLKSK